MNPPYLTRYLIWFILTALIAGAGTAQAESGDHRLFAIVDGYTVALAFPDDAIQTGSNDVIVTIHDAAGQPVTGAVVKLAAIARAASAGGHGDTHGASDAESHSDDHAGEGQGYSPIPTQLEAGPAAGAYRGPLFFAEPGIWTVAIAFTMQEEARAATFAVPVVQARPRLLVLGGFATVNGLVLLAAAVLKRNTPTQRRRTPPRPRPVSAPPNATSALSHEEYPA